MDTRRARDYRHLLSIAALVHVAVIAILITTVAGTPATAGTTTPPPPPFPWRLVFTHQPANAQVNDFITSAAYNPSGTPIQVSVVAANNSVVTSFYGTITLSFKSNPGNGNLSGTLEEDVSNGSADFPYVQIDQSGTGYRLHATACSGCSTDFLRGGVSVSPADSGKFDITDVVKTCDAGPCSSGDVTQGNTTAHMETSSGEAGDKLFFSVSDGALNCEHYKETSELVEFSVTGSRSKTVTIIIPRTPPTRGLSTYQVCYNSTHTFTDRTGQLVKTGLLPDCSAVADAPPCVVSRAFDGTNVVIVFTAPVGDPRGRG